MTFEEEVLELSDKLADDAFQQGYLHALLDTGVCRGSEPIPQDFDTSLAQHLARRRARRERT